MKLALGKSLSLHLALAALLGGLRASMPVNPNVVMVDWIELGERGESSPVPVSKPRSQPRPEAAPADPLISDSLSQKSAAPAAPDATESGGLSPAEQAQRLSLEDFYKAQVWKELQSRKTYPAMARRLGQSGKVVLRFKLNKDGSLLEWELLSKSPYPALNQAAESMLLARGFQPIPEKLGRPNWEFTVPVEFRLE